MVVLRVERLTKRFGGLTALDEVSFEISNEEIVGLIGPNGAGKSTCFNLVAGFLAPSNGNVMFNGVSIGGMPSHKIASLGLVRTFQHSAVFSDLSVDENIRIASHTRGKVSLWSTVLCGRTFRDEEEGIRAHSHAIATRVGLGDLIGARASDLSYGHLRKLGIAIALAARPTCLMLDEPAAGLNGKESNELLCLIRSLRDEGMSVVVVEHDMKLIMDLCDKLVVLSHGKCIAVGTPSEVRRNPEVIKGYLGMRRARVATAGAQC